MNDQEYDDYLWEQAVASIAEDESQWSEQSEVVSPPAEPKKGLLDKAGKLASRGLGIAVGTANVPTAAIYGTLTPYTNQYEKEEFEKLSLPEKLAVGIGSGLESAWDSMTKEGSFGKGYSEYHESVTGKKPSTALAMAMEVVTDPFLLKGASVGLAKTGMRTLPELMKYLKTGKTPITQLEKITPAIASKFGKEVSKIAADEKTAQINKILVTVEDTPEKIIPKKLSDDTFEFNVLEDANMSLDELRETSIKQAMAEDEYFKNQTITENEYFKNQTITKDEFIKQNEAREDWYQRLTRSASMTRENALESTISKKPIDDMGLEKESNTGDFRASGEVPPSRPGKRALDMVDVLMNQTGKVITPEMYNQFQQFTPTRWAKEIKEVHKFILSHQDEDIYKALTGDIQSDLSNVGMNILFNVAEQIPIKDVDAFTDMIMRSQYGVRPSYVGQELASTGVLRADHSPIRDIMSLIKERVGQLKARGLYDKIQSGEARRVKAANDAVQIDSRIKSKEKGLQKKIEGINKEIVSLLEGKPRDLREKDLWSSKIASLRAELKSASEQRNEIVRIIDEIDPEAASVKLAREESAVLKEIHNIDNQIQKLQDDFLSGKPYQKEQKPVKEVAHEVRKLLDQKEVASKRLKDIQDYLAYISKPERDPHIAKKKQLLSAIRVKEAKIGLYGTDNKQRISDLWDETIGTLSKENSELSVALSNLRKAFKENDPEQLSLAISRRYGQLKDEIAKKTLERDAIQKRIDENAPQIEQKAEKVIPERLAGVTDELNSLREEVKSLKKIEKAMINPPKTKEEIALSRFRTRLENEIASLNKRFEEGDLSKKIRNSTILDEETKRLLEDKKVLSNQMKVLSDAGVTPTKDEMSTLINLSNDMLEKRKGWVDDPKLPNHGWANEKERLAFGAAKVDYDNYLNQLRLSERPVLEKLKGRWQEYKTTKEASGMSKANWELARDFIYTINDNAIAVVASIDNSFAGRQGLAMLFTHPQIWADTFMKSFEDIARSLIKTEGDVAARKLLMADVYSRRNFMNGNYKKAGLMVDFEEEYPSTIPGRIPVVGRAFRASETAFLNSGVRMRINAFDLLMDTAQKQGFPIDDNMAKDLGRLVGSMTGRANVHVSQGVRAFLWAPKMMMANINFLTAHTIPGQGLKTKFARREAAKNLAKMVSFIGGTAAVINAMRPGTVEIDPRSADFLKVRVGDTRIDMTGGKGSYITLAARTLAGISSVVGGPFEGAIKNTNTKILKEVNQLNDPTGRKLLYVGVDFLMNKTAPLARTASEALLIGRTFEGDRPTIGSSAANILVPIYVKNIWEATIGDYPVDNKAAQIIASMVDFFGINANTYRPQQFWGQKNDSEELKIMKEKLDEKSFKAYNIAYNKMVNTEIDKIVEDERYMALSDEDKEKVINKIRRDIKKTVVSEAFLQIQQQGGTK